MLHSECIRFAMSNARDRIVIQVSVCDFQAVRQRFFFDREAMILCRDFNLAGLQIHDGLVGPAMTKLQLKCLRATSELEKLVPQADPKEGRLADQFPNRLSRVIERLGVSRTIGKEHAVWV